MRNDVARAFVLTMIAAVFGLLANLVSPRGLPLVRPAAKIPQAQEFVSPGQARELWSSGRAFFLDARDPADFAAGHIGNALNLPAVMFEDYFLHVAPMLAPDAQIIVYCDGTQCDLSQRLCARLKEAGYENVRILFNGWTVWKQLALATEEGLSK